jgi:Outer membrane protein beta-barrel domain
MKSNMLAALRYPACLLSCLSFSISAAEWTTGAGIAPAIEYTDNVCLSADNEEGEWIGLVTPDVSISGNGNRANVKLDASVEVNSLSDSDLEDRDCDGGQGYSNRQQFAPTVSGAADAILLEDWLFIDADTSARQNDVTAYAGGGSDSLDRTGNTNTTYRYSVSPYLQRRFKDVADLLLRYTYDEQYNSKDVVGDSSEQSVLLTFASGASFVPVSWGLQGDYSKVEYDDTPGSEFNNDTELKSARLNLGYQLNRVLQVNGYVGQEWNDFVSFNDDIDGDFWDVGLRWTPNARTTVEAGTGDRFFGATPRFSINYRHKRSALSASYNKDITYSRDIRTLGDSSPAGNATTLTNSPILDERFTLGYVFQGRSSGLRINASYSDQTRQDGQSIGAEDLSFEESTFQSVSVSVNRNLSRQLSLSAGASWDKREPKDSGSDTFFESETWRANFGVQRSLGENTSLSLDYQYTDRQSGDRSQSGSVFDEYTENRFTLTLRVSL